MVTATQLASYSYCPRKLFISDVLLVKQPVKKELVKGKVWHETYELINKSEESIVCSLKTQHYPDIFDVYRVSFSKFLRNSIIKNKTQLKEFDVSMIDLFKEYWPSFEEEAKTRALNVSLFIKKHDVYGKDLWNILSPKLLSECYYKSEKLNLSGVIDVIEIHDMYGKKVHVPIELKTGKFPAKGMWDGHRIQLAAYIMLLRDKGLDVKEGVVSYKDSDRRVLQMNTMLNDEIVLLIKKVEKLVGGLSLPDYVDNRNKCASCPFKEQCYDQSVMKELVEKAKERKKSS